MPWCPNCGAEYREGFERCSECGTALEPGPPPTEAELLGPEWVSVASFTTDDEAALARGYLQENGIPAELLDRQMHVQPYGAAILAEIQLMVRPDDAGRAAEVLAAAAAPSGESAEDPGEPEDNT